MGKIHFGNGYRQADGWKSVISGHIGEIICFADNTLRENFLWADGSPIDPDQYPELNGIAIKNNWKKDTGGKYLLPDLRGRFLLAGNENRLAGEIGGEENHQLSQEEMPKHTHQTNIYSGNSGSLSGGYVEYIGTSYGSQYFADSVGESKPHNNMPPYLVVSMQIRAKVDVVLQNICPYDVGDIFTTMNEVHPSSRWPSTEWIAITSFLLGASEEHPFATVGGEEKHQLTVDEMASHRHINNIGWVHGGGDDSGYVPTSDGSVPGVERGSWHMSNTGGDQPHNNMPPYLAVYMWKRVQ